MSRGKPKTNHNPGWKARARAVRRTAAEERQKAYDARPLAQKLREAGARERARLQRENP